MGITYVLVATAFLVVFVGGVILLEAIGLLKFVEIVTFAIIGLGVLTVAIAMVIGFMRLIQYTIRFLRGKDE